MVLVGDLNINLFNDNTSHYQHINNILNTFNLTQVITEPTRIGESTASLIDIICISENLKILNSGAIDMYKYVRSPFSLLYSKFRY